MVKGSHSAAVSDPAMFLKNSAIILLMVMVFRTFFGIYHMVWRYTSTRSYFNLILPTAGEASGIARWWCP